jgi:hypothetical protein
LTAIFAVGAFAVVTTSPASAVSSKVKRACKFDYKRLCPRYRVGSSRMRACMEAKAGDISYRCRQALIDSGEVDRRSSPRRRSSRRRRR